MKPEKCTVEQALDMIRRSTRAGFAVPQESIVQMLGKTEARKLGGSGKVAIYKYAYGACFTAADEIQPGYTSKLERLA